MLQTDPRSNETEPLEAAFAHRWEAGAYLGALLLVVALPALLSAFGLPTRRTLYREMPIVAVSSPFLEKEVFETGSDIDALFLGPSIMWAAIDAPLVRDALRALLDHEPVVLSAGYNARGADEMTYLLLHDILAHRKVRTLFITMPRPRDTGEMYPWILRFMGLDTALVLSAGLPTNERFQFLGASVLGAPRHLLETIRRSKVGPVEHAEALGALVDRRGWNGTPFEPFAPPPPSLPVDTLESHSQAIRFPGGEKLPTALQAHLQQMILAEAADHHVNVAVVYIPMFEDRRLLAVPFQTDWEAATGRKIDTVGAVPAPLFAGLSDDQIQRLYYDIGHLNANGARYFTSAIMPALLELTSRGESRSH